MQNKRHLKDVTETTSSSLPRNHYLIFVKAKYKYLLTQSHSKRIFCECAISKQIFHFEIEAFSCMQIFTFRTSYNMSNVEMMLLTNTF